MGDASSGNGLFGGHEARVQRLEAEHVLLRRDLTALLAEIRAINARSTELSQVFSQGLGRIDKTLGRLDVIEDLIEHTALTVAWIKENISLKPKRRK